MYLINIGIIYWFLCTSDKEAFSLSIVNKLEAMVLKGNNFGALKQLQQLCDGLMCKIHQTSQSKLLQSTRKLMPKLMLFPGIQCLIYNQPFLCMW